MYECLISASSTTAPMRNKKQKNSSSVYGIDCTFFMAKDATQECEKDLDAISLE